MKCFKKMLLQRRTWKKLANKLKVGHNLFLFHGSSSLIIFCSHCTYLPFITTSWYFWNFYITKSFYTIIDMSKENKFLKSDLTRPDIKSLLLAVFRKYFWKNAGEAWTAVIRQFFSTQFCVRYLETSVFSIDPRSLIVKV